MIAFILRVLGLTTDRKPPVKRSPRWPVLRAAHLKRESYCQACGSTKRLEVHHRVPVHLRPDLEMDPSNLITLCEGQSVNCHLLVGHLKHWKSWNPTVRVDAACWLKRIRSRPGPKIGGKLRGGLSEAAGRDG